MNNLVRQLLIIVVLLSVMGCSVRSERESQNVVGVEPTFTDKSYTDLVIRRSNWSTPDQLTIQGYETQSQFPLYIGDISTRAIKPLVINGKTVIGASPAISPDKQYIAFYNYSEEKLQIVRNNVSFETIRKIDVKTLNLAWSPDSQQLAFTDRNKENVVRIQIYDISLQQIETISEYQEDGVIDGEGITWSPNSHQIAFSLDHKISEKGERQGDIYVLTLDGQSLSRITNSNDTTEHFPSWGPNGIFTFTSTELNDLEEFHGELVFANLDRLCFKKKQGWKGVVAPSWSPDRSKLSFIIDSGIYIVKAESLGDEFLYPDRICE